jgi:hypothetical protein
MNGDQSGIEVSVEYLKQENEKADKNERLNWLLQQTLLELERQKTKSHLVNQK